MLILFPLFCSLLPFFGLGPNRSKLQDMLANLRDVDELPSLQPSVGSPSRPSSSRLPEHEINRADEGKYLRHSGAWKACGYTYLKSVIRKDSKTVFYGCLSYMLFPKYRLSCIQWGLIPTLVFQTCKRVHKLKNQL